MPTDTPRPEFLAQARAGLYRTACRVDRALLAAGAAGPVDGAALREIVGPLLGYAELVDSATRAHARRVGDSAEAVGLALGWDPADARLLQVAAQLHDLGKVGVPEAVLEKPGPLTPEERAAVELHTVLGGTLFGNCRSPLLRIAQEVARSHHEHWDGTGYPLGLAGDDIPPAARIVAVADVFDALTHARPYRPPLPRPRAMEMIAEGRGTHFDPAVVDAFLRLHPEAACA